MGRLLDRLDQPPTLAPAGVGQPLRITGDGGEAVSKGDSAAAQRRVENCKSAGLGRGVGLGACRARAIDAQRRDDLEAPGAAFRHKVEVADAGLHSERRAGGEAGDNLAVDGGRGDGVGAAEHDADREFDRTPLDAPWAQTGEAQVLFLVLHRFASGPISTLTPQTRLQDDRKMSSQDMTALFAVLREQAELDDRAVSRARRGGLTISELLESIHLSGAPGTA